MFKVGFFYDGIFYVILFQRKFCKQVGVFYYFRYFSVVKLVIKIKIIIFYDRVFRVIIKVNMCII